MATACRVDDMNQTTCRHILQISWTTEGLSGVPAEGVWLSLKAEHVSTVMLRRTFQNCHLIRRRSIFADENWSLFQCVSEK